jgi:ABC-type Fe3+-hydroxamate transport system substrate-binding protein
MAFELHSKGYPVFPIPLAQNLYGILANILLIGALVGRLRRAQELAGRVATELEASRVNPKYDKRPRIYIEIWPERYSITAGGLTFIDGLVYAAGARNIFSERPLTYFTPAFEDVAAANPDFMLLVFETARRMKEVNISSLVTKRGWQNIKATKQGKIAATLVKDLPLTHAGPSFVKAIRRLSEKLNEFGVLQK